MKREPSLERSCGTIFLKAGRLAGVAGTPAGVWDEEAITRAHGLLAKRKGPFDSFEIWEGSRFVFRQTFPAEIPDAHPPRRHRPSSTDASH